MPLSEPNEIELNIRLFEGNFKNKNKAQTFLIENYPRLLGRTLMVTLMIDPSCPGGLNIQIKKLIDEDRTF